MAGHPVWKTRSEYPDRLGISRGHIHCLMCYHRGQPHVSFDRFMGTCCILEVSLEETWLSSTRHLRGASSQTLNLARAT
jgi:hypothetical protein